MSNPNWRPRRPIAPDWKRFRRPGDVLRNPIVIGVVIVLVSNTVWAIGVYAWRAGVDATHEYWRHYGAGLVAEAQHIENPDKLHELIQRVQSARAP